MTRWERFVRGFWETFGKSRLGARLCAHPKMTIECGKSVTVTRCPTCGSRWQVPRGEAHPPRTIAAPYSVN